jgi:hypothetical protein
MRRAHSSATFDCEPLGEIGIVVVAPVRAYAVAWVCNQVVAVLSNCCPAPLRC